MVILRKEDGKMILKRKAYQKLLQWKQHFSSSYALLIEGARRIGKSTLVENFAKDNYKSYILIDFANTSKGVKDLFDNELSNLDLFFQGLSLEYGVRLYPHESLLIFDEVQRFPKARESIKYLVKDGRYSYIETGSLISIKENVESILIPSEEMKLKMYPLDFEEFLLAAGEDVLLDLIEDSAKQESPLADAYHKKAMHLFQEYLLVGGMPQSVIAYFSNGRDFYASDFAKRQILDLYRDDINKARKRYSSKVSALFENLPGYLSTHEKKVILSKAGDENGKFAQYDEPLFWLGDSMICNLCYKCNDPNVGFALNRDDSSVKCYLGDTGLLFSLAFSENEIATQNLYSAIMKGKLSINKGMLYENMIAQMLVAKGRGLYFYSHYSEPLHRNDMEIDFLLSNDSKTSVKVYPLEVKSSKNYTATSYEAFRAKFGNRIASSYIIHPKQFAKTGDGYRLPPYYVPFFF